MRSLRIPATMETSIFAFATDLHDEGVAAVLDNIQQRGGLGGITVAAAYHEARDIFPHNPIHKIRFLEGGALYFRPDPALWRKVQLQPRISVLVDDFDVLAEVRADAERRGLAVHAWAVFLHADRVRNCDAQYAEQNAFGDPHLTELCPANPDVRAYVRALSANIACYEVATIVAESLHYHPLEHEFHHERYLLDLGPRTRFLLGLCFCEHCLKAAHRRGVKAQEVLRYARDEIERVFSTGIDPNQGELSFEEACSLAGGEMAGYLSAREEVVALLVAEAADAAGGTRFTFMDSSGAIKGYATGRPTGDAAPAIAWRLGVDLAAVSSSCSGLEAIAYAADPERVRFDVEAYRVLLPEGRTLSAAMRPMLPDCDSSENLAEKLRVVRAQGLDRVDFYHYGLAPLTALDLIHQALDAA